MLLFSAREKAFNSFKSRLFVIEKLIAIKICEPTEPEVSKELATKPKVAKERAKATSKCKISSSKLCK